MELKAEEKRRFPRINLQSAIRYQIRGTPQFDNAISDDISVGGLGFSHDKFIAPATPLMLEINVLSRILRPIGRIAWASPMAHSYRNRMGIEFIEVDPQEKNYLSDFIKMQMGQL